MKTREETYAAVVAHIERHKAKTQAPFSIAGMRTLIAWIDELLENWRPTHRHVKRGSEYELLGIGKMQTACWGYAGDPSCDLVDMEEVAIYRAKDGSLWARPREEFEDGRFEALLSAGERQ